MTKREVLRILRGILCGWVAYTLAGIEFNLAFAFVAAMLYMAGNEISDAIHGD
jgi:hypothetical protein